MKKKVLLSHPCYHRDLVECLERIEYLNDQLRASLVMDKPEQRYIDYVKLELERQHQRLGMLTARHAQVVEYV